MTEITWIGSANFFGFHGYMGRYGGLLYLCRRALPTGRESRTGILIFQSRLHIAAVLFAWVTSGGLLLILYEVPRRTSTDCTGCFLIISIAGTAKLCL